MNKTGDPKCHFCGETNETFEHFVLDCPRFLHEQLHYFGFNIVHVGMNWEASKVLEFSYTPAIAEALNPRSLADQEITESQVDSSENMNESKEEVDEDLN